MHDASKMFWSHFEAVCSSHNVILWQIMPHQHVIVINRLKSTGYEYEFLKKCEWNETCGQQCIKYRYPAISFFWICYFFGIKQTALIIFVELTKIETLIANWIRIRVWSSIIYKNPTIYNIIHWFAGSLGQMTCQPSVWCSKYYFFLRFLAKMISLDFFFISFLYSNEFWVP